MTVETMTESHDRPSRTQSWGGIAIQFANDLAAEGFQRGDLAELRRMNPDTPDAAAFWRLMANYGLLGNPTVEVKWAHVLHGIAMMTGNSANNPSDRSAHDGRTPVGRALFQGDDPGRESAFYSESRLNRLLTARGTMLRTLLARMFRMMGAADVRFDWFQMAQFILNDDYDEERTDSIRRAIAREYYRAESRTNRRQTQ